MAPTCFPPYARHNAITVFCGSCLGDDPIYGEAADQLACAFVPRGVTLVYGGGTKGLMGRASSRALDEGGKVRGIIPAAFLAQEAPDRAGTRPNVQETIVHSMHERKKMMADLSYAFIGLPGGYGTLEEVADMTTWSQIGVHLKPVVLLNINGFYSERLRQDRPHKRSSRLRRCERAMQSCEYILWGRRTNEESLSLR